MKSLEGKYFVFDDGLIVLTTSLLSNTKTESDLLKIMVKCVAHIVLEHNLVNLKYQIQTQKRAEFWSGVAQIVSAAAMAYSNEKYDTNFSYEEMFLVKASTELLSEAILQNLGAKYSHEQEIQSNQIKNMFLNKHSDIIKLNDEEYIKKISPVISYSAWQQYHGLDYNKSEKLINKVKLANAMTPDDYLLQVKLKRLTEASEKSCYEILSMIETAKKNGGGELIDFSKEEALVYLRLNNKIRAKESLLEYKKGLLYLKNKGMGYEMELTSIEQLIRKL